MSDHQAQPVLQQVAKPLSLIPVGLKEAALDSPTFRATAVHFADQVELIERWLDGYVRATSKLIGEVSVLEDLVHNHLSRAAAPAVVSEAILDHDYTLLAMKRYGEGAREFWTSTIASVRKMESLLVEPVRAFLQGELRSFKESRRALDQAQRSFDALMARYAAQAKTKEPSALREDAFQLYEARRMYTKASMDFCILAPHLRTSLDQLLVTVCAEQWRDMKKSREGLLGSFGKVGNEMQRVRSWSVEMAAGDRVFRRELQNARKMLEDKATALARPSRELDEYALSTVPYLGSKGPSSMTLKAPARPGQERAEKQGWLFMRTLTGKPTRAVWVRRWFFVKNGIFGWLVQGSRTGGVEESERIGVLLCNVKPAFQEERRFCFEVKTKDNTILLQCEAQHDLMEWLESFEAAKRKAVEDTSGADSPTHGMYGRDAAFAINPPSAPEFAARPADAFGSQMNDEPTVGSFDRTSTLPVPERDGGGGLMSRGSFDVSGRKSIAGDRESEGAREHAARIIQKLDLSRKSTGLGAADASQHASPMAPSGGIASLISASHNILPVHSGPAPLPSSASTLAQSATKSEMTIANVAAAAATLTGPGSREMPSSTLAPSTLANPPAPTNLSKMAVFVSGERGMGIGRSDVTGGMPSGIMANLWGSSNWGYINRLERGEMAPAQDGPHDSPPKPGSIASLQRENSVIGVQEVGSAAKDSVSTLALSSSSSSPPARHRSTASLDTIAGRAPRIAGTPETFPWNYPIQLKTQEAQFRMFFPNASWNHKLLLVFRASWNPNEQQEFPGRVYVTANDVYFYSHYLGLVLTTGISLGSIEEVTAAPGKDCDFLFLHLKEANREMGYSRITIKTFLEPLRLLQRRLNFLVQKHVAPEPLDLEGLMTELLKLERDKDPESPSLESWEDVSINTPADDGTTRTEKDLRTTLRISGGLFDDPARTRHGKEGTKFKLPADPVFYVPRDYARVVVERVYDISPKALFHVLFGDKSAVFQLLYHERRAQRIKQGPWTQINQEQLQRAFEYQIDYVSMFGRSRQANVSDTQSIDILNDHLCYVVTDQKTPWHLPHHDDFTLVTKIVITYVAKSKCKLAIYTKVDWTKAPAFSKGLVEKQALDDLGLDALDLADVVSDQVRRLGAQSRTKKAITIFGHIGQQNQASQVTTGDISALRNNARRLPITKRSLTRLLLETSASVAESAISSIMIWSFALLRTIWKITSAHHVILTLLALSFLANLFYSSRDSSDWWRERNAGRFMARLGVGPNVMMSKMVYLDDLNQMVENATDPMSESHNECHSTFRTLSTLSDLSSPAHSAAPSFTINPSSRTTARRLRRTRQHLGAYRHDLLVAMRVINTIERETIAVEWENWLFDELSKCDRAQMMLSSRPSHRTGDAKGTEDSTVAADRGHSGGATDGRDMTAIRTWYESYCASCRALQT
ncbi:MAG: SNF1-interacting protein [Thelocarpon superellum]|nr:MAG: SNF1-interacting protein [Thelocarpon superellum]